MYIHGPSIKNVILCQLYDADLSKNANLRLDVQMKQSHAIMRCRISKTVHFHFCF